MIQLSVSLVTGEDIVFDIPEGHDGQSDLAALGEAIANCNRVIRLGQDGMVLAVRHIVAARIIGPASPEEAEAPKAGEPVAWDVVGDDGLALACDDEEHADEVLRKHGGRKRALYEAPPPAAIGVEGERFICIARDGQISVLVLEVEGPVRVIGTLAEATETIASQREPRLWELLRVSSPDAPAVDVAAIRKVIDTIKDTAIGMNAEVRALRSAIGEAK